MKYSPFTKTITDENNEARAGCRYDGEPACLLHNYDCYNCPIQQAMLDQLNLFEEITMEAENSEDRA